MSLILCAVISLILINSCKSAATDRPNVFVILADDLGWGNVDWHSNPNTEVKTPNLNKLAIKEGLELTRHYVHYVCCPTRSSFQSGRLPVHVTINACTAPKIDAGIPQNMTTIAHKFKEANYSTHMIGKYHIGMATPNHSPKGRGYDTSLIYWTAEVEYFTQGDVCDNINVTDLWRNNETYEGPAYDVAGTNYVDFLFHDEIDKTLDDFINNKYDKPWFMVWTPHIAHAPLQIPKDYLFTFENDENNCSKNDVDVYPGFTNGTAFHCRSIYESMVTLLDAIIGNVTDKLKANNLWNTTLLLFSSDNGGPYSIGTAAGNNYPLRGCKTSVWEGGIRASAFVSGGYLPENRRGLKTNSMIHVSDWYTTFCKMLGVDPFDQNGAKHGLPPVEGYDVMPIIMGINETSPRTQIVIDSTTLIEGNYKLIIDEDSKIGNAGWSGPVYPNSSTPNNYPLPKIHCKNGCLFDVVNDMTEHIDLSKSNKDLVKSMNKTLNKLIKGFYNNDDKIKDSCPSNITTKCACWMAINHYNGFYGPYCEI